MTESSPDAPSFTARLRRAAEPDWSAAVHHRFVDELFAGTIPDAVLAAYLVQDYQFCDAFVALLGAATASAPDLATRLPLARQLGAFAGVENDYFTETFEALEVSSADRTAPVRWPVTTAFVDLMLDAAGSRSYPRAIAVLTVAELLYRDWASLDRPWPTEPRHRGWVEVHHNPDFDAWVDWLVAELDHHEPTDPTEHRAVTDAFVAATSLERRFFDTAWGR